jgi:hypothetical protein
MRPTFLPGVLKLGSKTHYIIYLWSESWGDTDDWFYVLEKDKFKPYHRVKVYDDLGNEINPHYHYDEKTFKEYMNEFLDEIPLSPVIVNNRLRYLVTSFKGGHLVFSPSNKTTQFTYKQPKPAKYGVDKEVVKNRFAQFIMDGITPRIKMADIHLHHLIVMPSKKVRK